MSEKEKLWYTKYTLYIFLNTEQKHGCEIRSKRTNGSNYDVC
jgi:hypothetical protein